MTRLLQPGSRPLHQQLNEASCWYAEYALPALRSVVGVQSAHDSSYLVKHLLAGMPPVTERVKQMRQGRAPNSQSDVQSRNIQSQVCCCQVVPHVNIVQLLRDRAHACSCVGWSVRGQVPAGWSCSLHWGGASEDCFLPTWRARPLPSSQALIIPLTCIVATQAAACGIKLLSPRPVQMLLAAKP